MAGSNLVIYTKSELENSIIASEISAVIDQWQVRFGRYVYYNSSTSTSTHPSLAPVKRFHRRTWISTNSATVKLTYGQSSNRLDDAVLVLCLRSEILEEHFISKMHFSWPQVSCISGYPARGSRAVFVSYKDGVGQIQKFALQFLTNYEAENFMNIVKDQLQSQDINSVITSQSEAIFSHGPAHKLKAELGTASEENINQLMITISEYNAGEYSVSHEVIGDHKDAETMPMFPPSFTEMMKNCNPPVSNGAAKLTESGDLKTQFVQYLEGTSFKELLATVENVITQLGDDIVL